MLSAIPLMIVPFIIYNAIMIGIAGTGIEGLPVPLLELQMMSGALWSMSLGDLLIVIGLVMMFFEILKATRTGSWSVIDHLLSTFLFVAFILMVIAFVDVIAGFSVSIRSASRDVSIGL